MDASAYNCWPIFNCGHGRFTAGKRSPGLQGQDALVLADHHSYDGLFEWYNTRKIGSLLHQKIAWHELPGEVVNYECPIEITKKQRVKYTNDVHAIQSNVVHIPLHHNAKGLGGSWYDDAYGFRAVYLKWSRQSKKHADMLVEAFKKHTDFDSCKAVGSVVRLYENVMTKTPAVFCEMGFMTNRRDAGYLKSVGGISDCSDAICEYIQMANQ
jgi:hypothetical protein